MVGLVFAAALVGLLAGLRLEVVIPAVVVVLLLMAFTRRSCFGDRTRFIPWQRHE
jgi:hypothetical protein